MTTKAELKTEMEPALPEILDAIKDAQERCHAVALWELSGADPDFKPMGVEAMRDIAHSLASAWHSEIARRLAAHGAEAPPELAVVDGIPTTTSVMAAWTAALASVPGG